jgi:SAM-dependent methyltransferase
MQNTGIRKFLSFRFLFQKIWRVIPFSEALEKKVLINLLWSNLEREENIPTGSIGGRGSLRYFFELQNLIDRKINILCNKYYGGRHPKHYLWVSHNKYIYDGINEAERVLDIGCGASHYQQWIAEKASEVIGVDINRERVEQANRNNRKSNVRFELMDATTDLPRGRFDVVICSHVLEHLDDPSRMLLSLAENIPRMIVKVPLQDSHWMKLVKKDIGLFWMDDRDHRREYTEETLRVELKKCGWHIEELVHGADLRATAYSTIINGPSKYSKK